MIDQRITHRSVLTDIASGQTLQRGKPTATLQILLLVGFVAREPHGTDNFNLRLTEAGHMYLSGLWH
ncbi:hypothetical protein [Pseudomonas huanghezhanensis]|uniref:hypothetical protein n=1 Tax=Pseudomonas huanghezhanensis TaxID=3002903 RepID=UPI0022869287|nr:hypothetical protein [Pseudomonas sp. BSw22131]